ncbi:MAG: hypothetical protein JNJ47_08475, partial [Alphaproteobacteria bacterium]|nr:hypothetical protein [Alphaproteobacteria bacterium]
VGLFAGINEKGFINYGKIVSPIGATFFGENAKIKTQETSSWDYKGPFIKGNHGFLTNASFENKGEINTGISPLILRNIKKVIHNSAPKEEVSFSKVELFNKMLLQAEFAQPSSSFQLDKLSSFLLKGNLRAGDLIIETALFSPKKIKPFPKAKQSVLGHIELKGDIRFTRDNSLLWLSAGRILNQTPITVGELYSFLFSGLDKREFNDIEKGEKAPEFINNNILRFQNGALQGLINKGTVQVEGDFGISDFMKKHTKIFIDYNYQKDNLPSSSIRRNDGIIHIKRNAEIGSNRVTNFIQNTGTFELLGNGNNLYFAGEGAVKIGSKKEGPSKIHLTFSKKMGDVYLSTQTHAYLKMIDIPH